MAARLGLTRRAALAIALLLASAGAVLADLGANQTAHLAAVRSFHAGTPHIDRVHEITIDKAFVDGHFYSVKAPGLAFLTLPPYAALEATGAADAARRAGRRTITDRPELADPERGPMADVREERGVAWALGLVGVLLPAGALLVLLARRAEAAEPGLGALAAVGLGAGTLVLPFSTLFYSHVLGAALAFAAATVLLRGREHGDPRVAPAALAGLLAGLAITVEYPTGLVGVILAGLVLAGPDRWRRLAAYAAGGVAGVLPLAAYNVWAFGTPFHITYENAVAVPGETGRDVLGLNDAGFFGIELPRPGAFLDLLLSGKGLLVVCPVVLLAAAGLVLLARRGRAEAAVAGAVVAAYLVWNSGYYLPFGGDTPGPRFLVTALPFLALGLAPAARRWPGPAVGLLAASVTAMALATTTKAQLTGADAGEWVHRAADGRFEFTLFAVVLDPPWLAALPVLLGVAAAVAVAAGALRVGARDAAAGAVVVTVWALVAVLGSAVAAGAAGETALLVAACGGAGLAALTAAILRPPRSASSRPGSPPAY